LPRTKLDNSDTGFVRFHAKRHEVKAELGVSVLHRDWSASDVLMQLTADSCPFMGTDIAGLPKVIGWPSDSFRVKTTQCTLYFKAE